MITKKYSKTGRICRVTFKLPAGMEAETAALVGEFNNWDPTADQMKKLKDGSFSTTVSLEPDQAYRFRYYVDGERWENDQEADGYEPNRFGSEDSVVRT